eukprot:m.308962 g.308962  ORF g.308962 m.308962 type:complete len:444 (+) comp23029_c0_seq41:968-2299(+)
MQACSRLVSVARRSCSCSARSVPATASSSARSRARSAMVACMSCSSVRARLAWAWPGVWRSRSTRRTSPSSTTTVASARASRHSMASSGSAHVISSCVYSGGPPRLGLGSAECGECGVSSGIAPEREADRGSVVWPWVVRVSATGRLLSANSCASRSICSADSDRGFPCCGLSGPATRLARRPSDPELPLAPARTGLGLWKDRSLGPTRELRRKNHEPFLLGDSAGEAGTLSSPLPAIDRVISKDAQRKFCRMEQSPGAGELADLALVPAAAVAEGLRAALHHQPRESLFVWELGDRQVMLVDCRFPFEYTAGHIVGAINLWTANLLHAYFSVLRSPMTVVCYCEYSQSRGPHQARVLRFLDQVLNKNSQHRFYEVVLLHGGYKEFFRLFPDLCDPPIYVKMTDDRFKLECSQACLQVGISRRKVLQGLQAELEAPDLAGWKI